MQISKVMFNGPLLTIGRFHCPREHPRFATAGAMDHPHVVFPRTGVLIHQVGKAPVVADSNLATLYSARQAYVRKALDSAGDICDWFALKPALLDDAFCCAVGARSPEPAELFQATHVPTTAAVYASQRLLNDALATGWCRDALAVEEAAVAILTSALAPLRASVLVDDSVSARAQGARQRLAREARALLAVSYRERLGLAEIAARLKTSPFHLARAFSEANGVSMHQHRLALRLRASLELVAAGEPLATVALTLGFASHSHFTTQFSRVFAMTPKRFRDTASAAAISQFRTNLKA